MNYHIHTTYSFSPYTPTEAAREAKAAGLTLAGIVDHDTVAGAPEFTEEGRRLGLKTSVGVEMRVYHAGTPIGNRRTNHPDQTDISYLVLHDIEELSAVTDFLAPVRQARGERNRAICERLGISYERDVLPLSMYSLGGTVTERHILFALCGGDYAKMGCMKSTFTQYIPAERKECPDIQTVLAFAKRGGLTAAYPYLGDVTYSVTNDKRPQTFEDGYLEELLQILFDLGIPAVTYAASRNTPQQLRRLFSLCKHFGFKLIPGEDINQPGQAFRSDIPES